MRDADRFTRLYRQHSLKIFRFALHMSGSATVAEEVSQETFLILIRQPDRFDPARGEVEAFLFGVARNLVRQQLDKGTRFESMEDVGEDPFTSDEDILADLTKRENIQVLNEAILSLPAKYREAVVLCDLQEMSYEKAADVMKCAVGTVRSRLHRARNLLLLKLQSRCLA